MALPKEAIEALKTYGLDVDKLITAVKAEEEVAYEVPKALVFKQEDLDARDANKIAEGKKAGEKTGEEKGRELAAKALKSKFNIEDPAKELDKVVELVNAKVATGDAGLREQNNLLIQDKKKLEGELQAEKTRAAQAAFDTELISMFPANRGTDMTDAERLTLAKMQLQFEEADGKKVVKRNGEILRDAATQNPLPLKQVIADYFTERKWISATNPGGRGGSDNPPPGGGGGIKSFSAAQAEFQKANPDKNPVSDEFDKYVQGIAKDVSDFDWDH